MNSSHTPRCEGESRHQVRIKSFFLNNIHNQGTLFILEESARRLNKGKNNVPFPFCLGECTVYRESVTDQRERNGGNQADKTNDEKKPDSNTHDNSLVLNSE